MSVQYSLLKGFFRLLFSPSRYRILIVGLDCAGKTTLLESLRHRHSQNTANPPPPPHALRIPPTVGLNILELDYRRVHLVVWDLGGQSGLRVIWNKYFADANAVIYVVDASDTARVNENRSELDKVLNDHELVDAPILIAANKQDKSAALDEAKIRSALGLPSATLTDVNSGRLIRVQPISAINGNGVDDALDWIIQVLPNCARTKLLADQQ